MFAPMKTNKHSEFGSLAETIMYPLLLLILMWSVYLFEITTTFPTYMFGILPQHIKGLKGIIFSPLLHSVSDYKHILNNSGPIAILLGTLIYFYRSIAAPVFFTSWIITGALVWAFAGYNGAYHIGMSSIIYALAGFLFVSGTIRKHKPLQVIALFVIFMYGSLIWGIFPTHEHVSWEGHFSGLITGIILAVLYKKKGPQAPKYQYEIEQEMGIPPPDLEGQWLENIRIAEQKLEEMKNQQILSVNYEYKSKQSEKKPENSPDDQNP
jgi:membrane associated rhomboid family serine protease